MVCMCRKVIYAKLPRHCQKNPEVVFVPKTIGITFDWREAMKVALQNIFSQPNVALFVYWKSSYF